MVNWKVFPNLLPLLLKWTDTLWKTKFSSIYFLYSYKRRKLYVDWHTLKNQISFHFFSHFFQMKKADISFCHFPKLFLCHSCSFEFAAKVVFTLKKNHQSNASFKLIFKLVFWIYISNPHHQAMFDFIFHSADFYSEDPLFHTKTFNKVIFI